MYPPRAVHPSEHSIRAALRACLLGTIEGGVVIEEVAVRGGACRVDLALVNGVLHGYEIKSHVDVLGRLKTQAGLYSQVFDRMTLVAAPRHLANATAIVPGWWGVTAVNADRSGRVRFQTVRIPEENPRVDAAALAEMLWREESWALLGRVVGTAGLRVRTRSELHALIARDVPLAQVRAAARQALVSRAVPRVDVAQRQYGG